MLFLLVIALISIIQGEDTVIFRRDVFISGQDGYHTYRIPAMVVTNTGTVLAFCEGRKSNAGDVGDIDLLLKRSEDDGRNWSKQMVVHEEGGNAPVTIGNPCPIVEDESDRIHLLFTRNNKRLFYTKSVDDGLTWASPKEFTSILKGFDYPLVRIATGPVHGIQMRNGRLIAPVWVCDRERKDRDENPANNRYQSGIIYSDDQGETWMTGALVRPDLPRLNECTLVEKIDNSLLLNMRAYRAGYRAVVTSTDGGATWLKPVLDKNLPGPTCQGSMIRLDEQAILFLNPASEERENLTLRMSTDEGQNWAYARVVNQSLAAYSDLAVTKNSEILCLFENGTEKYHEKISLVKVSRNWLAGSKKVEEKNLTNHKADDRYGSYSPDGKRIIFESNRDGNWEIYIMDSDGQNQARLTQNNHDDRRPCWHPEGNKIIYESTINEAVRLNILDLKKRESKEVPLQKNYQEPIFSQYSPDGKKLTFSNKVSEEEAYIVIVDEMGKEIAELANNGYRSFYPRWSPDSESILYFSRHETNNQDDEIYSVNIDGSDERRLTNWPKHNFCPTFSNDGNKIAYVTSMEDRRPEIYIMDRDGGNQKRITFNEDGETLPSWSSDDKKILITGYRNGNFEIIELKSFD